jgi:hydrogenase-4 component B
MRAGMVMLAALCVVLGLAPTVVLPALTGVAAALLLVPGAAGPGTIAVDAGLTVAVSGDFASVSTPTVAVALAAALAATVGALAALGAPRARRTYETWGCGRLLQTARMEYTATAFSNPFKRVFDFLYRPAQRIEVDAHPASRFFVRTIRYSNETRSVVHDWLYDPLDRAVRSVTGSVRLLQSGSANVYLAYILAALLLMLVLA